MAKKYILTIGLNDKDTKIQKVTTLEAYKVIENTCKNLKIEGYTIYECLGYYSHLDGDVVTENSLRIEIYYFDSDNVKQIKTLVEALKISLNQESVAVEIQEVNSYLW